ncbi:CoA transferase [Aldersonia kunmingensis]|uniref:CoA transferase n=1 Tax=Aldersonia kunmingensis TaxID=408066 RepID=UPI0008350F29|nr:CoA transferase [Aldersonia kunmingensis]
MDPFADHPGYLAATLPVRALAVESVAAFADAADRYRAAVSMPARPSTLRLDRITASFASDRLLRIDGAPVSGFAELSGFFAAADGWVRTHANYPHHRDRLLAVLGLDASADRETVARRIEEGTAAQLEDGAASAGAIAVRVRTEFEWAASEPGQAAAHLPPLLATVREDTSDPAAVTGTTAELPLTGVRALDLTRVIAGPTATRALALLGADVLRIDSPELPEIAWQHLEMGQGKRSALLDVHTEAERALELVAGADVLVTGYRPGALDDFGVQAVRARPGLVRARVSAWGTTGPWAARRGFDSIVQAASGIALIEGDGTPGALPAQALDHATGYFLAAGVLDALTGRLADRHGRDVDASLARTAARLLADPARTPDHRAAALPSDDILITNGRIRTARPVLPEYDDYPEPASPWGSDAATWRGNRNGRAVTR